MLPCLPARATLILSRIQNLCPRQKKSFRFRSTNIFPFAGQRKHNEQQYVTALTHDKYQYSKIVPNLRVVFNERKYIFPTTTAFKIPRNSTAGYIKTCNRGNKRTFYANTLNPESAKVINM